MVSSYQDDEFALPEQTLKIILQETRDALPGYGPQLDALTKELLHHRNTREELKLRLNNMGYVDLQELSERRKLAEWRRVVTEHPHLKSTLANINDELTTADETRRIELLQQQRDLHTQIRSLQNPLLPFTASEESNAPVYDFIMQAFDEYNALQHSDFKSAIRQDLGIDPRLGSPHLLALQPYKASEPDGDGTVRSSKERFEHAHGKGAHQRECAGQYVKRMDRLHKTQGPRAVMRELEAAISYVQLLQTLADDLGMRGNWEITIGEMKQKPIPSPIALKPMEIAHELQQTLLKSFSQRRRETFNRACKQAIDNACMELHIALPDNARGQA